jgi:hypothetical protein
MSVGKAATACGRLEVANLAAARATRMEGGETAPVVG